MIGIRKGDIQRYRDWEIDKRDIDRRDINKDAETKSEKQTERYI